MSNAPEHVAVRIPASFTDQLKHRAKAVVTACGVVVETAAIALLSDPSTEKAVAAVVPQPYQVLIALAWGALVTAIVHQIKNHPLPGA